jgi:hypothetical protein
VPPQVRERVLALFGRREPGIVIADVARDSVLDDADPSGPRVLEFLGDGVQVRLVIDYSHLPLLDIAAEVQPAGIYSVTLRGDAALFVTETDDGQATFADVPRGLTSVLFERRDTRTMAPVRTAWTRF